MAQRTEAPFRAQDPAEITQLVQTLHAHVKAGKGNGGFSVKKATFTLPSGRAVDSWRMQDWDYKKPNLPTYARGLFTYKNKNGQDEIAVRGYDKFFNHGEVKKTEWRNVEKNTIGPYELSVKENGCIIFISGLDDGTLLVCSKHSTGGRSDKDMSHAEAGEKWVEKHLATVGKTKEDLARTLRQMNATAVAELCDDTFEEHVLAYNPETSGLYLHGINLNLPEFATYPGHLIDQFAADWGFKKTMYVMEDDIKKVKSFLDGVAETGAYAGRETEGFVIRCQARDSENAPYEDWFFKYKFEEPYLMYRQWRECTKAVIAGRPPKYKKHKAVTEEYLAYARHRFSKEPKLMAAYNQNHGIISLRDDFLRERGLKGSDIIRQEIEAGQHQDSRDVSRDVVLVPVATIGCGKTTVALGLVKLFGWGHVQNDNISVPKGKPMKFAEMCCETLAQKGVVIADRNNHQRREREQLIRDMSRINPHARFVALHYVHDRANHDQIRKAMQERVLSRGDNHQTIQAGTKGSNEVISIMDGFLARFQPVNAESPPDDGFDHVIDLDVTSSSRENIETVVAQLNAEYPKLFGAMPTGQNLDDAIEAALNDYRPEIKHEIKGFGNQKGNQKGAKKNGASPAAPKPKKMEYFCVKIPSGTIGKELGDLFNQADSETQHFYRQLQSNRRVQDQFHVTLIHRTAQKDHADYWNRLNELHNSAFEKAWAAKTTNEVPEPDLGSCKVQLERVVWDNRVMCIVVRLLNDANAEHAFETTNKMAHITVGTASQDIKPKESNDLLTKWLQVGSGPETGIKEAMFKGAVVIEGQVKGIQQRF
ncbi:tRNA ligase [Saccharata proteae CBS 121410]|uniref:tRNA ligase n=1 Tax=Saccharata proteae CBS 121410 TaxID=1314787 RepID=A0A6A5YB33_9PEZI|nr:tRNA ligase [Saccharata proteae CBS 121410]